MVYIDLNMVRTGVVSSEDVYELKESEMPYSRDFDGKMSTLRLNNRLKWRVYNENSV